MPREQGPPSSSSLHKFLLNQPQLGKPAQGACAGVYDLSTREAAKTPLKEDWSSPKPGWIKGRLGGYASLPQRSLGPRPSECVVVPPTPRTLKEVGTARGKSPG